MEFKNKEQRLQCYNSRDAYYECLDQQEKKTDQKEQQVIACKNFYEKFEQLCGSKWTEHFVRKRDYLRFKDRIEKEGFESVDKKKI